LKKATVELTAHLHDIPATRTRLLWNSASEHLTTEASTHFSKQTYRKGFLERSLSI